MRRRLGPLLARTLLVALAVMVIAAALLWWFGVRDALEPSVVAGAVSAQAPQPRQAASVAAGAYLARAGNCKGCHTRRGGAEYAGGRAIETPFGVVHSSNLTPDALTGIGAWSAADFWRAMHHGRSRDGRLLVPAFPYANTTRVLREDSDALFAFLMSRAAVEQANPAPALRWPFGTQPALALWRALYFRAAVWQPDAARSPAWNRGAYLVGGLGHCSACHSSRNAWGAEDTERQVGGMVQGWYAPSLLRAGEAGLGDWDERDIVALLRTGVGARASVSGPMAEVVLHGTQYLSNPDLSAVAVYLRSMQTGSPRVTQSSAPLGLGSAAGSRLYEKHCANCHGDSGEGVSGAYPALAGNRAVLMGDSRNLVQMVLRGGFAPATDGNPRPFGMPPYQVLLSDGDIAAVLTYIRGAWGNSAAALSELDVARHRGGPLR